MDAADRHARWTRGKQANLSKMAVTRPKSESRTGRDASMVVFASQHPSFLPHFASLPPSSRALARRVNNSGRCLTAGRAGGAGLQDEGEDLAYLYSLQSRRLERGRRGRMLPWVSEDVPDEPDSHAGNHPCHGLLGPCLLASSASAKTTTSLSPTANALRLRISILHWAGCPHRTLHLALDRLR